MKGTYNVTLGSKDILRYARKFNKRLKWIPPSIQKEMLKDWDEDDKLKMLGE